MSPGKLPTGKVPHAGIVGSGASVGGTINAGAGVAATTDGAGTGAIMFDRMPVVELLLAPLPRGEMENAENRTAVPQAAV